jgi:regulator of sigma E protease
VVVNFITALMIYIMILFISGRDVLPAKNVVHGVKWNAVAHELGLQDGDVIKLVNGYEPEELGEISELLIDEELVNITVLRGDKTVTVNMPDDLIMRLIKQEEKEPFVKPLFLPVVDSVLPESAAKKGGLLKNDRIIAFNGTEIKYFNSLEDSLQANKEKDAEITILRGADTVMVTVSINESGIIGIVSPRLDYEHIDYSFIAAIPAGMKLGVETLAKYVRQMKYIFTKEGIKNIGGFSTIGNLFAPKWDWHVFWMMTAFISIILAFMNILPIPALDGGHVLFLSWEMITGRKPNEKILEYAQIVGMILLLALMIYANTDWLRGN